MGAAWAAAAVLNASAAAMQAMVRTKIPNVTLVMCRQRIDARAGALISRDSSFCDGQFFRERPSLDESRNNSAELRLFPSGLAAETVRHRYVRRRRLLRTHRGARISFARF